MEDESIQTRRFLQVGVGVVTFVSVSQITPGTRLVTLSWYKVIQPRMSMACTVTLRPFASALTSCSREVIDSPHPTRFHEDSVHTHRCKERLDVFMAELD